METPLVSLILPMFRSYPMVIPSLYAQTYKNFEIILVHDGPFEGTPDKQQLEGFCYDPRLKIINTQKPGHDWGHAARAYGLDFVAPDSDLIVFGGVDNYYVDQFLEYMVKPFENEAVQVVFCNMMHDIRRYEAMMDCKLQMGLIDCGNFMTRTENAKSVGWKNRSYEADWKYINEIQEKFCKNLQSVKKIPKMLFIHN